MEETCLRLASQSFFCSLPNIYLYSGFAVPTLDMFYLCTVADEDCLEARDDAAEAYWLPIEQLDENLFGLCSIRNAVRLFKQRQIKNLKK